MYAIADIVQAAAARSTPPKQWEKLVRKNGVPLPDELLASLLPYVNNARPSPMHLQYLELSLRCQPPLSTGFDLLSALLRPLPAQLPAHLVSLILAYSTDFLLPILPPPLGSTLLALLHSSSERDRSDLISLTLRFYDQASVDPEANEREVEVIQGVRERLKDSIEPDAVLLVEKLASVESLLTSARQQADLFSRPEVMTLLGEGPSGDGADLLDATFGLDVTTSADLGLGSTSIMDMALASEVGELQMISDVQAQISGDVRLAELVYSSLISCSAASRSRVLAAALAGSNVSSALALCAQLLNVAIVSIAAGSSRSFALAILVPLIRGVLPTCTTFPDAVFAVVTQRTLDMIDRANAEPLSRKNSMVQDDVMSSFDFFDPGFNADKGNSPKDKAARPLPFRDAFLEACHHSSLASAENCLSHGFDTATASPPLALTADEGDVESHVQAVLDVSSSFSAIDAFLKSVEIDATAQSAVARAFNLTVCSWATARGRGLGSLSHVATFFTEDDSRLRFLDMMFQFLDNGPKPFVGHMLHFLADFTEDDAGDAQGLLTQYGHVAVFAQILLRRYSLDRATFSPIDDKAVTTDVFRQASSSYPLSSLNDEDKALVSGWIGALYGHGIADDLLQSTPPRTLLRLAATLVSQSITSHQRLVLDFESLKDGLSFFIFQPFLSWSLVGIFEWLVREIRRLGFYSMTHLKVLQMLVQDAACPQPVLRLLSRSILELLESDFLDLVVRGETFDLEAMRKKLAPATDQAPPVFIETTPSTARGTWEQAISSFARRMLSPQLSTSQPAMHLPIARAVHLVGPRVFIQQLWQALLSSPDVLLPPPLRADVDCLQRFASLVVFPWTPSSSESPTELESVFWTHFVIETERSLSRLAEGERERQRGTLVDVVRAVAGLTRAMKSPGREDEASRIVQRFIEDMSEEQRSKSVKRTRANSSVEFDTRKALREAAAGREVTSVA